jgi:PucR C-terminal helix-turn-helix domain
VLATGVFGWKAVMAVRSVVVGPVSIDPRGGTLRRTRAEVCERLRARRSEIEQAVLMRAYSLSAAAGGCDAEYEEGLRAAVSAAVEYGLAAFEAGSQSSPRLPKAILAQARLAARNGVSLDVVLRRYFAGYALLADFIGQEGDVLDDLRRVELQGAMRDLAGLLDRVVAAVTEEYAREPQVRLGSEERRRAEQVKRLLSGELLETSGLDYDLDGWHVGVITGGIGAEDALRGLASALDRRLLLVWPNGTAVWGWLGGRRCVQSAEIVDCASSRGWPGEAFLALGEPGRGLAGWRFSHRQASTAVPIALRVPRRMVRYADVSLLASVLQDDLLAASLRQIYLAPLTEERDGGAMLRQTLRAYLAAERNISSAAAALGVSRRTVANRLQRVEEILGSSLGGVLAEIEMALRLEGLDGPFERAS